MALTVLHFIACDRVYTSPTNLHTVNIEGLKTLIRAKAESPFPLVVRRLQILTMVRGGEGYAEFSFRIVHDSPRQTITVSEHPRRIHFVGEPDEIKGMKTIVENCTFPRPGLYWVELLNHGDVIARQPLRLVL